MLHRALALAITLLGLAVIITGIVLALQSFYEYKPLLPPPTSLSDAVASTVYELLNLVVKLAFLGVVVWGGSIALSKGLSALIDLYRVDKGVDKCMEQRRSAS